MAFSPQNRGPSSTLAEINVTPLVDVMLVLLIIFMISAPLLTTGVEIDLPEGNSEMKVDENNILLAIDAEGKHYLDGDYLQVPVLLEKVQGRVALAANKTVYVKADENLRYGLVLELVSHLRENGITEVGLITEPDQK